MSDQPSGAAKRKAKRLRDEQERRQEALRRTGEDHLKAFRDLGAPPMNDVLGAITYATNALMLALQQTMVDPILTADQRRRAIVEITRAAGMIQAKAHTAQRVKALEAAPLGRSPPGYRDPPSR